MSPKNANYLTFWIIGIHFVAAQSQMGPSTNDAVSEETTPSSQYATYEDRNNYFYSSGDYPSYTDDEDGVLGIDSAVDYNYTEIADDYEDHTDAPEVYPGSHLCDGNVRVGRDKVCDGQRDCHDCTDEENCPDYSANFFSCYEYSKEGSRKTPYTADDPRCIPLRHFCDGLSDCLSGEDEIRNGSGFKCQVKDMFQSCVLPDRLLCDGVANCEDRSDVCQFDVISGKEASMESVNLDPKNETNIMNMGTQRAKEIPKSFFKCLGARDNSKSSLISQKQVCDGAFDCEDLSDECLCQVQMSEVVRDICGGLCTPTLWADQTPSPNCEHCPVGQIYRPHNSSKALDKGSCLTPVEAFQVFQVEITKKENLINATANPFAKTTNEDHVSDVIECIDQSLTSTIRARKCDGRPECFLGEDECGIGCKTRGDMEWVTGSGAYNENQDPPFCVLRTKDLGQFTCLSDVNKANISTVNANEFRMIEKPTHVLVCDGFVECSDGSDEAFCPTLSRCHDSNVTNVDRFDILQKCDGYAHCSNEEDENPAECARVNENLLPCGGDAYFHITRFIDGDPDCSTKADECPPFLSRIPEIRGILSKNENGEDMEPPPTFESGISSHDRAIDNLSLQIFLVAASFIGLSALSVSLVLVLYNLMVGWGRFVDLRVRSRDTWLRNSLICLRESVVNLNLTISKMLVCGYFAYIKITRSEDVNYSSIDLRWRSSSPCAVVGALCFIGTQIPLFSLAGFAIAYTVSNGCKERHRKKAEAHFKEQREQGDQREGRKKKSALDAKGRTLARILVFFSWFILQALIWFPVLTVAHGLITPSNLHIRTQSYAWTMIPGARSVLKANLLDQQQAMKLSSIAVALTNNSSSSVQDSPVPSPLIDFHQLSEVLNTAAPSLGMVVHGTFGYFGQSGSCLPDYLVHVNSGQVPYDMAVSNYWSKCVSIGIVVVDVALILLFAALTLLHGAAVVTCECIVVRRGGSEIHRGAVKILNSTFSSFVIVESLTWLFVFILFVAKIISPTSISDNVYMVWCLSLIGINCGLLTPFLLLKRKFRLLKGSPSKDFRSSGISTANDGDRIIEVDHDEEANPLTNGNSPKKEPLPPNETHSLVDETRLMRHQDNSSA